MICALVGNQNCGKTTLFNQLTDSNQHVGNFPGVTVEQKVGSLIGEKNVQIVDLPGVYSLFPYTKEEAVTYDFLLKQKPDVIINITDATNIERNLYLTIQLIELQIPMVLALNMMDEVQTNNGSIDAVKLQKLLGIPVVPISAAKKQGLSELIEQTISVAQNHIKPERVDFCFGAVHRSLHAISHLVEAHAKTNGIPVRFAAARLIEGDESIFKSSGLTDTERDMIEKVVKAMELELSVSRADALIDMRYKFIEDLCMKCVVKPEKSREHHRSECIDRVLTHKTWGIPSFLGIMLVVFWITFGVIGNRLSDFMTYGLKGLTNIADKAFDAYGLNAVVHSLIVDGIFEGVGAVVSFVPIIVTLFFFLSILEDSGYMARVAFIMDRPLRRIGLSGRSFVPMLMGLGCSVPAIMAARTLPGARDRKMTILLIPFMSCSAKLPIYALFTAAFFKQHQALVMTLIYLFGIFLGIVSGLIMKKTIFKGASVPFIMELPNYRFPSAKTVFLLIWDKAKDFVERAFTIILLASVIIWFLQSFDVYLNVVTDSADSILADMGRLLSVIFAPIGLSDWRVGTALITGFTAKEAVISTLAVLTDSGASELGGVLQTFFSPLSSVSFLVFTLLYTPCVAAISTVRREMGSLKWTIFVVLYQTGFAWVASFVIYRLGTMVGL